MPAHERFAAWILTGPVGHFASGAADWVTLARYLWRRRRAARGRGAVGS